MCLIRPIDPERDRLSAGTMLSERDVSRIPLYLGAIEAEHAFVLIAEVDSQPIGWVVVHLVLRDDMDWGLEGDTIQFMGNGNAYLENLAVREDWRSRGIGTRLLRATEVEASARSTTCLWLHTRESNAMAHRFYERQGWKHDRIVHPSWMDGTATRVYRKSLMVS